jgi:hypothetical protein
VIREKQKEIIFFTKAHKRNTPLTPLKRGITKLHLDKMVLIPNLSGREGETGILVY